MEKWPEFSWSSFFWLSSAILNQQWFAGGMAMGNAPGSPTVESFVEPFEALMFVLFDMLLD
jgi:hypothetical protein